MSWLDLRFDFNTTNKYQIYELHFLNKTETTHNDQVRGCMQTVFVAAERRYLQGWGQEEFLIQLVHDTCLVLFNKRLLPL